MLQNEVLKNERFIGALNRSAQNTVVPLLCQPRCSSFFFPVAPTAKYIFPLEARREKHAGIIPIMNTVLSNVTREGNVPWKSDNLPVRHKISVQRAEKSETKQGEVISVEVERAYRRGIKMPCTMHIRVHEYKHTRRSHTRNTDRTLGVKHKPKYKPGRASVKHKTRNATQRPVTDAVY